jgi:hypothetical protein
MSIHMKITLMKTRLTCYRQLFILAPLILVIISSCKEDDPSVTSANSIGIMRSTNSFTKGQVKLGIHEMDSSIYKLLYMVSLKLALKA